MFIMCFTCKIPPYDHKALCHCTLLILLEVPPGWDCRTAPAWDWGTPSQDLHTPRRDLGPVTGVPLWRTWGQWKYYGMDMGYPPGVNRQTPVKTVPSPSFRCWRIICVQIVYCVLACWQHFSRLVRKRWNRWATSCMSFMIFLAAGI